MPATELTFAAEVHTTAVQTSVLGAWRDLLDQRFDSVEQRNECIQHDPEDFDLYEEEAERAFFWESKVAPLVHRGFVQSGTGSKYNSRHVRIRAKMDSKRRAQL